MFDLTSLDYIYIGVVLISTVWASIRGGVYETVTMVSWIVAALAARWISPYLGELFQTWFKLAEPTIGTLVASYFIVFFVILLVFSFFNQKLRDYVQGSMIRATDHTLGIVFGIIRGIVIMGFVYWGLLWYYTDSALPSYVTQSRTRPVMQLTIVKIHDWFIPGDNKLLEEDILGAAAAQRDFENLINPAVKDDTADKENSTATTTSPTTVNSELESAASGTGYKDSERDSLENKLLQIESVD